VEVQVLSTALKKRKAVLIGAAFFTSNFREDLKPGVNADRSGRISRQEGGGSERRRGGAKKKDAFEYEPESPLYRIA
jgi:hypothetical protein